MSRHPRKINRAVAERLLRGEPAESHDRLAVLLATVAACRPGPAEQGLAGEDAAVAAFRAARSAGTLSQARGPGRTRSAASGRNHARWVRHPVQLAVVAVTITTAGGIALAAGTAYRSPTHAPGSASATESKEPGRATSTGRASVKPPAGTPEPSMTGLCRAYMASVRTAPGKALDNPAFASLIRAAGGKDKVAGYCASVPESKPGKRNRGRPPAPQKRPKPPKAQELPTPSTLSVPSTPSVQPTHSITPGRANPSSTTVSPSETRTPAGQRPSPP